MAVLLLQQADLSQAVAAMAVGHIGRLWPVPPAVAPGWILFDPALSIEEHCLPRQPVKGRPLGQAALSGAPHASERNPGVLDAIRQRLHRAAISSGQHGRDPLLDVIKDEWQLDAMASAEDASRRRERGLPDMGPSADSRVICIEQDAVP